MFLVQIFNLGCVILDIVSMSDFATLKNGEKISHKIKIQNVANSVPIVYTWFHYWNLISIISNYYDKYLDKTKNLKRKKAQSKGGTICSNFS